MVIVSGHKTLACRRWHKVVIVNKHSFSLGEILMK